MSDDLQQMQPTAPTRQKSPHMHLSRDLIEHLRDVILKGASLTQACAALDIDRVTVWRWKTAGVAEQTRRAEGLEVDPAFDLHVELAERLAFAELGRVPRLVQKADEIAFKGRTKTTKSGRRVQCPECGHASAMEQTVTTEESGPDGYMLRWLLAHLGGPTWQSSQRVDVRFDAGELVGDFQEVLDGLGVFVAERLGVAAASEFRVLAARLLREKGERGDRVLDAHALPAGLVER